MTPSRGPRNAANDSERNPGKRALERVQTTFRLADRLYRWQPMHPESILYSGIYGDCMPVSADFGAAAPWGRESLWLASTRARRPLRNLSSPSSPNDGPSSTK